VVKANQAIAKLMQRNVASHSSTFCGLTVAGDCRLATCLMRVITSLTCGNLWFCNFLGASACLYALRLHAEAQRSQRLPLAAIACHEQSF
jgi:hypothetical protein